MEEKEIEKKDEIESKNESEIDYIEKIKELKNSTVKKEDYLKLKEENRKLLESLITAEPAKEQNQNEAQKIDVNSLREKLFGNSRKNLNNLDFVKTALDLRNAMIENGELDPFVPCGSKIKPTDEDFLKAQKVADVLQECVDYAEGNQQIFTDELKRRIN